MPLFLLFSRLALFLGLAALAAPALAAPACPLGAPGTTQRVAVAGTGRSMLIHIPVGVRHIRDLPLVFLLHGSTSNGQEMLDYSGLAATSDHHGFLLAAPDAGIPAGKGFVWNIPGVPTVTGAVPAADDPDDVAYLTAAIDWLAAQKCIDVARVYATGLSGGGRMTSWLGCVASDRFAAIAPVVGLRAGNPSADDPQRPDPATCQPKKAVPVYAFAGSDDTTNPVAGGGAGYWQYSMATALARWAELDGCRIGPQIFTVSGTAEEQIYSNCRGDARVAGRIVAGRGHEWVADNEAMWTFFARYRR
ncbi:alpha/beta hydrolase family esterase [Sphingopyxis indica]|uniref:Polyhydroxybutyrate depolymerase n=1 Tax=Sphingopyxis indica TaxID=436663 RepID=A0A239HLV1_9SPHN|nr:PHB depolymerase family esterase [Sphingopyxis indica]SNS82330.1 polyhydroxybutyrate depolymerase [Sphingopyxis indica]